MAPIHSTLGPRISSRPYMPGSAPWGPLTPSSEAVPSIEPLLAPSAQTPSLPQKPAQAWRRKPYLQTETCESGHLPSSAFLTDLVGRVCKQCTALVSPEALSTHQHVKFVFPVKFEVSRPHRSQTLPIIEGRRMPASNTGCAAAATGVQK